MTKYDLVVIGGGPAGTAGALAAAAFGKSVILIEKTETLGGAGINTGTIPSKTLRESALLLSGWRARKLLGIEVTIRREAKLSDFMYHERQVASASRQALESRFRDNGIATVHGQATFLDQHTVGVTCADGRARELWGSRILIATGSSPLHPPEFAFDHPRIHDSNEILEITTLPTTLAVVGAGVIGAEYACTFAALGVEVHLIDGRDSLLPFLDTDVSLAITKAMKAAGVQFHWGERVVGCDHTAEDGIQVSLSSGGKLHVTDVLVAAGRSSNTSDLNLAAAKITPGKRGLIPVDSFFCTEVPHIHAAGDVVGPPALAATGMEQARVAVCHAFDLLKKESFSTLPTGIYTIPEASMVGETEQLLKSQAVDFIVGRADYLNNARGRIIGDEAGFLKLLFRREDMRLLGVHAVGEQATELVHIGLIAILCKGDATLFSNACFNYPTLGDLYKTATYDAMLRRMGSAQRNSQGKSTD